MKIKKVILFVGIILFNFQLFADSPLTSIQFWSKDDGAIVVKASKSNGKINNEIINYLLNPKNLEVKKLIVVNALGWKFHSENNSIKFQKALFKKYQVSTFGDLKIKAKPFDLSLYAYILGFDNYFDVKKAKEIAEYAKTKSLGFGTRYVFKLLEAQDNLSKDWCTVYSSFTEYSDEFECSYTSVYLKTEQQKLRNRIIESSLDYIRLYRSSCKQDSVYKIDFTCNKILYHVPNKSMLWVQFYPILDRDGKFIISNQNQDIVYQREYISDDYALISTENLTPGSYTIDFIEAITNKKRSFQILLAPK